MSNQINTSGNCGCCEDRSQFTPISVVNLPKLDVIQYRAGTHGTFMKTMLSALNREPALKYLTTKESDDPAIGLLDAWSAVLDVLTFYQERIANEGYMLTATEHRSVLELARHIGYEIKPGVAASTYLSFMMEKATGAPAKAIIPKGTKAQSIPGQNELPQTFETTEEITARPEWNHFQPYLWQAQSIDITTTRLYLKGTDLNLRPGDPILIADNIPDDKTPMHENWDFRIIRSVAIDNLNHQTLISWDESLGQFTRKKGGLKIQSMPARSPRVFTFRQRAALFGHNAPDWLSLSHDTRKAYLSKAGKTTKDYQENNPGTWGGMDWPEKLLQNNFADQSRIYLDTTYPRILSGSWVVLQKPTYTELYYAKNVYLETRSEFTMSAKSARIDFDTANHLSYFPLRDTIVFAQSEELELAEKPAITPVFGDKIIVSSDVSLFSEGKTVIISGIPIKQLKVRDTRYSYRVDATTEKSGNLLKVYIDEKQKSLLATPGKDDILEIMSLPILSDNRTIQWNVRLTDGKSGFVFTDCNDPVFETKTQGANPGNPNTVNENHDKRVFEIVTINRVEKDGEYFILHLAAPLKYVFFRDSVSIFANTAKATHGETKHEILGSGDGSKIFQKFILKQKPLTYLSSSSFGGIITTLEIRVNNILWKEVPTLFGCKADDRVYTVRISEDGSVTVQFGDGITGARLPSGSGNVGATFRLGTGFDGHVEARQISQLISLLLGVKSVSNPLKPSGADNPESFTRARENAPLSVLAMGRIVSLQDFEDYARAFAGIGKARADLFTDGEQPVVFLSLAAADGGTVPESSDLFKNLLLNLRAACHTNYRIQAGSYRLRYFTAEAGIIIDQDHIEEEVTANVILALKEAYSFEKSGFGRTITPSELIALIIKVEGVIAVDLDKLDGKDPNTEFHYRLIPDAARWKNGTLVAAELLAIQQDGIKIHKIAV